MRRDALEQERRISVEQSEIEMMIDGLAVTSAQDQQVYIDKTGRVIARATRTTAW